MFVRPCLYEFTFFISPMLCMYCMNAIMIYYIFNIIMLL